MGGHGVKNQPAYFPSDLAPEEEGSERWQSNRERIMMAVSRYVLGEDATAIPNIAPAIARSIAVQHFLPPATPWNADTIPVPHNWGEAADD